MNDDADDTPQEEIRDTLTPFEAYDAVPLCPTCFNETGEDWDFCLHCNAPLGPFVGYDPLKRIYTLRFLIYQGVTRPRSMIVVIGFLLIYGSNTFAFLFVGRSIYESVIEIMLFALFAMFYSAICIRSIYLLLRNALVLSHDD